jgi:hypothetical protein
LSATNRIREDKRSPLFVLEDCLRSQRFWLHDKVAPYLRDAGEFSQEGIHFRLIARNRYCIERVHKDLLKRMGCRGSHPHRLAKTSKQMKSGSRCEKCTLRLHEVKLIEHHQRAGYCCCVHIMQPIRKPIGSVKQTT